MSNKNLSRVDPRTVAPRLTLPTLPEAFANTDYDGWLMEAVKRFQLQRYQKTQSERIEVLKQINEIQTQCLALMRNESNWQHFGQEDRIRQKRLDLQEMELDQRLEDQRYERERALKERANPTKAAEPAKRRGLLEDIASELEKAISTQANVTEVFRKAREANPGLTDWLDDLESKIAWDLRERKWF